MLPSTYVSNRVSSYLFCSYQRADPNFVMLTPNKEHLAEGLAWKIGKRPMLQSDVDVGNFDGLPRELRPTMSLSRFRKALLFLFLVTWKALLVFQDNPECHCPQLNQLWLLLDLRFASTVYSWIILDVILILVQQVTCKMWEFFPYLKLRMSLHGSWN